MHSLARYDGKEQAFQAIDFPDNDPAVRKRRHIVKAEAYVLYRHFITHLVRENVQTLLHDLERNPLPGTAMPRMMISASLRDEVKGAPVPIVETIRLEQLRLIPQTGKMIRSVAPLELKYRAYALQDSHASTRIQLDVHN